MPFASGGEELPVDARLVVVALEVAGRGELDQVRVALVRLGEEGQVRVALLLRSPVVGDVDLAAEQRLDALLPRLAVELDGAGQAPVVGERDRRHLQLGRPRRQLRDAAGPVEDRVLRVDVEVDELGHARQGILGSGHDTTPFGDAQQSEGDSPSQRNHVMLAARVAAPSPMMLKRTLAAMTAGTARRSGATGRATPGRP